MGIIKNYKIIGKSVFLAVLMSLILLFFLSIILAVTSTPENIMSLSIIFIASISILISAFLASRKVKEKGIIYGAIIGFVYMLTLYFISSFINWNFLLTTNTIVMILGGIIGGAIGGILGVNLK